MNQHEQFLPMIFGIALRFVAIFILLLTVIPKQVREFMTQKDNFTAVRGILLLLGVSVLINDALSSYLAYCTLTGEYTATFGLAYTISSSNNLFAVVLLFLIYNKKY